VKSNKRRALWEEIAHQAQHSPGGDEVIAACYQAMVNLAGVNNEWRLGIERAFGKREMPDKHKVNLIFRGIQYLLIFYEKEEGYPHDYGDVRMWEKVLPHLFKKHRDRLRTMLREWDTGTTIYQRYAGLKAILSALWPNRKLSVLDLGCGGNHGLPGMVSGEEFGPIVDHSQGEVISGWLGKRTKFRLGMSVDKHDPYDQEIASWRVACSFYPSELAEMKQFLQFEKRIRNLGEKIFFEGDITDLNLVIPPETNFDAVVMSTVLYQMEPKDRILTIKQARKRLRAGGVLVVQDFVQASEDGSKLEFNGSWFKDGFAYRTYVGAEWTGWKWWEVLAWYNGRCKQVREGEDFGKFFAIVELPNRLGVRVDVK
jgi:SAM-dependent methyltransferase